LNSGRRESNQPWPCVQSQEDPAGSELYYSTLGKCRRKCGQPGKLGGHALQAPMMRTIAGMPKSRLNSSDTPAFMLQQPGRPAE
jgi:hypothetical protein